MRGFSAAVDHPRRDPCGGRSRGERRPVPRLAIAVHDAPAGVRSFPTGDGISRLAVRADQGERVGLNESLGRRVADPSGQQTSGLAQCLRPASPRPRSRRKPKLPEDQQQSNAIPLRHLLPRARHGGEFCPPPRVLAVRWRSFSRIAVVRESPASCRAPRVTISSAPSGSAFEASTLPRMVPATRRHVPLPSSE